MELRRLLADDGSWNWFESEWADQLSSIDNDADFNSYSPSSINALEQLASAEEKNEWSVAITRDGKCMAAACFIRANQKGLSGWTLRVREVTVCPLLDYGELDEKEYIDTLIDILNGAVKLSERDLQADHIKLHLRSPADANFFRAFRNELDGKGAFAMTEAHGAWLTLSKVAAPKVVK